MSIKSLTIDIDNMVCTSCEKTIDKNLKKVNGIIKSKSNFQEGKTYIEYDEEKCSYDNIVQSIEKSGYSISKKNTNKKSEIIPIIGIIVIALFIVILSKNSSSFDISNILDSNIGYIAIFSVGLLSSLHCIGMCGGIMMSQSISIKDDSLINKLKPSLLYNLGRLISYTILGGIVGGIGSVFSLSSTMQILIYIFAGIFMIFMGFNMSGFKTFRKFNIKLPWSSCKTGIRKPFIVGLLNGFMPCGPLQTMQLYALATGSVISGALSMFFFSLGTIPLMLIFGVLTNVLNKKNSKKLIRLSGLIIIVLGFSMATRGVALTGFTFNLETEETNIEATSDSVATIADGKQTITISAGSRGYTPKEIYIQKDLPTELIIKGDKLTSCNNTIYIPSLNIQKELSSGENVIEFTPEDTDTIKYSCWMGMIRGNIKVVDDLSNINIIDGSNTYSEPEAEFYGLPLSSVPTERLIKKATVSDTSQSLSIANTGTQFEPLVIIAKENLNLNLEFNVNDTSLNGTYTIYDETLNSAITTFEIQNGKGNVSISNIPSGSYAIIKDNYLYSVIETTPNIDTVNLEDYRTKYF